jgi:hypothetical protein
MLSREELEKIKKLPVWAERLILRLASFNEPMADEVVRARRELGTLQEKVRRLSESNEALLELLRCAGRGGSDYAATVVKVLEGYEIYKPLDKGETKPEVETP